MSARPAAALLDEVLEKDYQREVIELARMLGWRVAHFRPAQTSKGWRTPVAADGQGWPDLVLCRDRLVAIELKRERGRTSEHQREWLRALIAADVETYLVRPSLLQPLAAVLAARRDHNYGHLSTEAARAAQQELLAELRKELRA